MLDVDYSPKFPRDYKRCIKKHWNIKDLENAMSAVAESDKIPIPNEYNDHALSGNLQGCRLLHIGGRKSNWVLLYIASETKVVFSRTGTHDEVL
jgi:mRNA interferase YafQ